MNVLQRNILDIPYCGKCSYPLASGDQRRCTECGAEFGEQSRGSVRTLRLDRDRERKRRIGMAFALLASFNMVILPGGHAVVPLGIVVVLCWQWYATGQSVAVSGSGVLIATAAIPFLLFSLLCRGSVWGAGALAAAALLLAAAWSRFALQVRPEYSAILYVSSIPLAIAILGACWACGASLVFKRKMNAFGHP
jgi:hypothetical protein